jgi:2,4-dienoyl-CoA reductase-like NADH-dependent reductase (Old Yellow Enzyme family)
LPIYAERAIGGAGMIVIEPMPVHAAAVLTRRNFRHSDDLVIPHFKKLVEAIKDNGAAAIQQLFHIGAHGGSDNSLHPHRSPSGLSSCHDSDGSHPMTEGNLGND